MEIDGQHGRSAEKQSIRDSRLFGARSANFINRRALLRTDYRPSRDDGAL